MSGTRYPRNLDAGPLQGMITSHQLELARLNRSAKTRKIYRESAQWFAAECLLPAGVTDWADVTRDHLRSWSARLYERGYSDSYVSNQWRALQALLKFVAEEEGIPNPMSGMAPPRVKDKPVPIFTDEEIAALFATARGRDFADRRDLALMFMLRDTGIRLAEAAGQTVTDIEKRLLAREAEVTGKGGKTRVVKYSYDTARALDRYLRVRERRLRESSVLTPDLPALWIGPKGALTDTGIYQLLRRRAAQAGIAGVHPHRFRHHFAHTWLDRGGAEGDLMELTGWESEQMLRRYGRSAASARARRGYDRIMNSDGQA